MTTQVVATATDEESRVAVSRAVELLRQGQVVALPTETVYGLAADALQADAALKIFEAKERPRFDPLIVHLPSRDWLERLTSVPKTEQDLINSLADAFWPGPLTLVLRRQSGVPDIVTAGLDTVAVRMSAHPIFAAVAREFGKPLAAPSANRFGRISPTQAAHVLSELDGRIPLVVDGGPTTHGLESTIVRPGNGGVEVLRHGPITAEQLGDYADVRDAARSDRPQAPGQLPSHYAPRTRLILTDSLGSFVRPEGRIGALAFERAPSASFDEIRVLAPSGDLRIAAANLFRCLRELDGADLELIVAEEVPERGLGTAIMDRLRRAAAR